MLSKVPKSSIIVFVITFFIGVLISFILLAPQSPNSIDYIESDISEETQRLDIKIKEIEEEKNNLDTSDADYVYKKKDLEHYIQDIQKKKEYLIEELNEQKKRHEQELEQWKSFQIKAIIISFFVILVISFVFALIAYWVIKSKPQGSNNAFPVFLIIFLIISFIVMIIALGNNESDVAICFALLFGSSLISFSINRKTK